MTRRTFIGVYALDEIVYIKQKSFPSAYVFNLDLSYKPGLQSTLIGKDVLNISILLDALSQEK